MISHRNERKLFHIFKSIKKMIIIRIIYSKMG
jgi:hypothetical protein